MINNKILLLKKTDGPDVIDACLSCICEASSGCDINLKCQGTVCGPYKITKPFWIESGKPTLSCETTLSPTGIFSLILLQDCQEFKKKTDIHFSVRKLC
jgi:hypothetical protein